MIAGNVLQARDNHFLHSGASIGNYSKHRLARARLNRARSKVGVSFPRETLMLSVRDGLWNHMGNQQVFILPKSEGKTDCLLT